MSAESHRTRLDCPCCDQAVDARYLGTADTDEHDGHVVGWECTECGAELQEDVDANGSTFDLRVVDSSPEGDPPGLTAGVFGIVLEPYYVLFGPTQRCPDCGSTWRGYYCQEMEFCHFCGVELIEA